MATYFLNCSDNIENFNLCLEKNVAGFPYSGYKTGDLIYLIVKENKQWKLGARGYLLEPTNNKPWPDSETYKSAFNIDWELIDKVDITEGLRNIYKPNFGLAIQGKKDIDTFQNHGEELKEYFNSFFTGNVIHKENKDNMANNIKATTSAKTIAELIKHAHNYILSKGFKYNYEEIANFYLSLKAKPFIILAGISGTGKTQLPRKFAESLGFDMENQIIQVPVRPDWTDGSELLGYTSLDNKFSAKDLTLAIQKALKNSDKPYFFILDEMNLARVEHYFSDYLSIIETRSRDEKNDIITDKILREEMLVGADNKGDFENLRLPQNLYLIGTVNMDETTHSFSRKVLDRANSIEMNDVDLNWIESDGNRIEKLQDISNDIFKTTYLTSSEISKEDKESIKKDLEMLIDVNHILEQADLHFAYRVRDEVAFYLITNKKHKLIDDKVAIDFQLVQKVIPRIHGSSERVKKVLIELLYLLEKGKNENVRTDVEFSDIEKQFPVESLKYMRSSKKILFMLKRYEDDRFTSPWI